MSYNGIGCAAGESGESAGGNAADTALYESTTLATSSIQRGLAGTIVCPMCLVARVFYFIQRVTALLTLGSRPELARS